MRRFVLLVSFFSFLVAAGIAAANPLQVELVSQGESIQPGKPFYVGLRLQHPPGYHSYWKFAGIVGVPTAITWKLPPGWSAAEIQWPEPEPVLMFAIKAQGFHGEKLLPIKITPPKNLPPGQSVLLEGKARWMCCGRDCNPGFQDLSISLPVAAQAPVPDARWDKLFAQSLASAALESTDWTAAAERDGASVVLRIKPASDFARQHFPSIHDLRFFTDDGLIDLNEPSSLRKSADEFVLTQTISKFAPKPFPKKVIGILQTPEGWLPDGKPNSITIAAPFSRR